MYLSDIEKKLSGKYSTQEIGRAMRNVFKGTIIKSVRNKEYWAKLTKLYMGVEWKKSESIYNYQGCDDSVISVEKSTSNSNQIQSVSETENNDSSVRCAMDSTQITLDHQYCNQDILLRNSDHEDMKIILNSINSDKYFTDVIKQLNLTNKQHILIQSQIQNKLGNHKSRRWNPEVIRLCLSIYSRSPKNYEFMAKSGYFILPSSSHIRRYKNRVDKKSGINKDVFNWMKNEASILNLPEEGYEGGLLIDEMSNQADLQLKKIGQEYQLIGFTDICIESLVVSLN